MARKATTRFQQSRGTDAKVDWQGLCVLVAGLEPGDRTPYNPTSLSGHRLCSGKCIHALKWANASPSLFGSARFRSAVQRADHRPQSQSGNRDDLRAVYIRPMLLAGNSGTAATPGMGSWLALQFVQRAVRLAVMPRSRLSANQLRNGSTRAAEF